MKTRAVPSTRPLAPACLALILLIFTGCSQRSPVTPVESFHTPSEIRTTGPSAHPAAEATPTSPSLPTQTPGKALVKYRWEYRKENPGYLKIRELVDRFNGQHPDLQLSLSTLGDEPRGRSYPVWEWLDQASQQYDCFTESASIWREADVFAGQPGDSLLSLNDLLATEGQAFEEDFYLGLLDLYLKDGQLYALPAYQIPDLVVYNLDLLARRGLQPPADDWMFDDLISLAQAAASQEEYDLSYGFQTHQWDALLFEGRGVPWADWEGLQADPPWPEFDRPEMIGTLAWIVRLNRSNALLTWMESSPEGALAHDWTEIQNMITAGQVAFWRATPEDLKTLSRGSFQIGLAPMPLLPGTKASLGGYASYAHFISKTSGNPKACWEWFKFLSEQPDAGQGIPARRSIARSTAWEASVGKPQAEALRLEMLRARPYAARYSYPRMFNVIRGPLQVWWNEAVFAALSGADPAQALTEAQAKADAYLVCMKGVDPGTVSYEELESKVNACVEQAGTPVSQDYAEAEPSSTPVPSPTSFPTQAPFDPTSPIIPDTLAWHPKSRWLAYAAVDGTVWLRDPRKTASIPVTGIHDSPYGHPQLSWSPDGSRLLVSGGWTGEGSDNWACLWVVPVDDTGIGPPYAIRLPVSSWDLVQVSWSPDGQSFAYTLVEEAWIFDFKTKQTTLVTHLRKEPLRGFLTEPFDRVQHVLWSPQGDYLALQVSGNFPSPFSSPAVIDIRRNTLRLLGEGRGGYSLSWSPDGRVTFLIAYGDTDPTYTFDHCAVDLDTGQITNITRSNPAFDPCSEPPERMVGAPSPYQSGPLAWSAQGRYLYETYKYIPDQEEPARGFIVRSDPNRILAKHLGNAEHWYIFPAWLAGERYAYIEASAGYREGWSYQVDRAFIGETQVWKHSLVMRSAAWSPDGAYLALVLAAGTGDGKEQLLIQPLGQGE